MPRLDIAAAWRIAQQHVGGSAEAIACWQRSEGMYRCHPDENAEGDNFYFAVVERLPMRVGGTRHVAVHRRNGAVSELGILGE